jgi:hypothetical protein
MVEKTDFYNISAQVITDLAKSVANSLFNQIKKHIKDVHNKEEIDFGYAFENYLSHSKNAYSKIKTILFKHEGKELYSFYESMGISYNTKIIDSSNVNNVLELGHNIIITGTAGIGKTIMMKHFLLNSINNGELVPILVELRGVNDTPEKDINIIDYIFTILNKFKFKIDKEYYKYSLEMGRYLILFDGYDEVKNNLSGKVSKEIINLCEKYPENYYIVSSRPMDEFVGWNNFIELESNPLTKEQALSLIRKLDYNEDIKSKFYNELESNLYDKYETFASNPLLLTIMLLTFENRACIPSKLNDFFEQAFTTLFYTHDASKGCFKRDILCGLGYEDFKIIFSYFCFKTYFNSEYEFTENKIMEYLNLAKKKELIKDTFDSVDYLKDLTSSVCMLVHEGLNYRFSHRSFQEYFAAVYSAQLVDDIQRRFLTSWLKEHDIMSDNFLHMLYELQPNRFINNVLYPGLTELNEQYISNDSSKDWLVETLYYGISIFKFPKIKDYHIYFVPSNFYYNRTILYTCNINNYDFEKDSYDEDSKAILKIIKKKYSMEKCGRGGFKRCRVSIKHIKDDNMYDQVLEHLSWAICRFDFAMECLEKYNTSTHNKKRKFESIFDEL